MLNVCHVKRESIGVIMWERYLPGGVYNNYRNPKLYALLV